VLLTINVIYNLAYLLTNGWWLGIVVVTCFIRSTKLLYAGPS